MKSTKYTLPIWAENGSPIMGQKKNKPGSRTLYNNQATIIYQLHHILYPLANKHNYGKSPCFNGKTHSKCRVFFDSYAKLPENKYIYDTVHDICNVNGIIMRDHISLQLHRYIS